MANLKNMVYLTREQYNTLLQNGSVTSAGTTVTYDPNDVYLIPASTQKVMPYTQISSTYMSIADNYLTVGGAFDNRPYEFTIEFEGNGVHKSATFVVTQPDASVCMAGYKLYGDTTEYNAYIDLNYELKIQIPAGFTTSQIKLFYCGK